MASVSTGGSQIQRGSHGSEWNPGAPDAAPVAHDWRGLFEQFPYGIALVDAQGRFLNLNDRGADLLAVESTRALEPPAACCDLICRRVAGHEGCLTRRALAAPRPLPEMRVDIGGAEAPGAVWVTASMLDPLGAKVVFHLRPAAAGDRRRRPRSPAAAGDRRRRTVLDWSGSPKLRIHALGSLRLEAGSGPIGGEWLDQRPGQLLKYLLCERSRAVASEQIAEALWPNAGQRKARASVRYCVFQLRSVLEPGRPRRAPSSFVVTRRTGYVLQGVWTDTDEFERLVCAGTAALTQEDRETAREQLAGAWSLYRGDFLADDPYADWAMAERDRLSHLASRALGALVELELEDGRLEPAAEHARELAEMEPFDVHIQRRLLEIYSRLGWRSKAMRRYGLLRSRMRREFGEEPDFDLSEIAG